MRSSRKETVFLSYSRRDSEFADRLKRDLEQAGIPVWRDVDEVRTGDYLLDRIADAVKSCGLLIAVVSLYHRESQWCRHEVRLKLTEEVQTGAIRVLPIRLDDTDPENLVPAKGWADFRDPQSYNNSLRNLQMAISYHLDPMVAEEKKRRLEDMLKQAYVDACYGTLPAKEALERFHTAATMNPESVFVSRALGYIYHFHLGDFVEAEKHYLRALENDPKNAPVARALGVLYLDAMKPELARKFLMQAADLGYTTAMEWREYSKANVQYVPGPHGVGGIPILLHAVWAAADEFIRPGGERSGSSEPPHEAGDG